MEHKGHELYPHIRTKLFPIHNNEEITPKLFRLIYWKVMLK